MGGFESFHRLNSMARKHVVVAPKQVPVGISELRTQIGIHVINVHYTADPNKRHPEWRKAASQGIPKRDWQREYEIDWSIATGTPVWPDYDKSKHSSREVLPFLPVMTYVGIDFGLNPAATFHQIAPSGQFRTLRALNESNRALSVFIPRDLYPMMREIDASLGIHREAIVTSEIAERYKEHAVYAAYFLEAKQDYFFIGDPAGRIRESSDGKSGYDHYASYGITIHPGKQAWADRREAVTGRLVEPDIDVDTPKFIISNHPSCDLLRMGFEGSYAYAVSAETGGREMPIKDKFSHPQDAAQYVMTWLFPTNKAKAQSSAGVTTDYAPLLTGTLRTGGHPVLGPVLPAAGTFEGEWNPFRQSLAITNE